MQYAVLKLNATIVWRDTSVQELLDYMRINAKL